MKTLLTYPRFNEKVTYRPPMGIAYLGGILKVNEVPVVLRDAALYNSFGSFVEDLKKLKPELVGISMPSALYYQTLKVAKTVKEIFPKTYIVVGGPHPTIDPVKILEDSNIDFAVFGEGEYTLLELLLSLKNKKSLSEIRGLAYKEEEKIIVNPPREFIENLDELPWPARELLEMNAYLKTKPFLPMPYPSSYIIATRGCFGNCFYCQPILRKLTGRKIRVRSPKSVVDEIEFLIKEYKIKSLNIGCDEPTGNKEWIENLCNEIIRRKVKIKMNVPSRVDTINETILKKMRRANFIHITYGVESGSQKILNIMRKGVTVERALDTIKKTTESGICARANLMVGTPGETKESIYETIKFIKKAKPDFIMVNPTSPTPGSDLYFESKISGNLISNGGLVKDYRIGYFKLENLSFEEVQDSISKVISVYKKEFFKFFINPITFWKKRYLIKYIFFYFISLLKNPKELLRSIYYILTYQKTKQKKL